MTNQLTTQEKIDIINSHIKNIAINQYNVQLNLVEENAKPAPDASNVLAYNNQITQMTNQIVALEAEAAKLSTAN
jgi:hypothetical protein